MSPNAERRSWSSRYPPLAGIAVIAVLLVVLPSSLTLPQANPSQTLEYAPVPPNQNAAPPGGNVASLGLGSSSTVAEVGVAPPPPPKGPPGSGARPSTKRCVGNPPRQTADPMSPPCVAYFQGDNGGATATGVKPGEVVVLVYIQAQEISAGLACHQRGCDVNTYYDLGKPEGNQPFDEREAYWPHVWRVWQRYFNERYQTYGRFVHLWVHFGRLDNTPEARRADVADEATKLNPFAIIADVDVNGEAYADEWARRGRAVFMTKTSSLDEVGFNARFFQKYPGAIWAYEPSVQQLADNFGSFLCAQVVGHPVSFSGDGTIGQPRKLGLLKNSEIWQNRIDYAALIKKRLEGCGATIASEQVLNKSGPFSGSSSAADADTAAAAMRQAGVTTIIYLAKGPASPGFSHSVARQVGWRPEWIVQMDNALAISTYEDQEIFQYVRNFTLWPRAAKGADRPCEHAYAEVEPNENAWYEAWTVCYTYNTARMLFTGLQVAGPRLTLDNLDEGMHAIPAIPSGDPKVPACFYRTGDYTCVKDAQLEWWDPTDMTDRSSGGHPGCWKSIDNGARYLPGAWPKRDVDAVRRPASDTCNINYE